MEKLRALVAHGVATSYVPDPSTLTSKFLGTGVLNEEKISGNLRKLHINAKYASMMRVQYQHVFFSASLGSFLEMANMKHAFGFDLVIASTFFTVRDRLIVCKLDTIELFEVRGDANLKLNAGTENMVMTATSPPSSCLSVATRVVINVGDKKCGHKWLGCMLAAFGTKNWTLDLDCYLQGGGRPVFVFVLGQNVSYQDHGRHLVASSMLWNWTMEHLERYSAKT